MIQTYSDLKRCLQIEKQWYLEWYTTKKRRWYFRFTHQHRYEIWRYVRLLRICEYLLNSNGGNPLKTLALWWYERRRNRLGNRLGICITPNVFDEGLFIDHIGHIIINPYCRIGKNCHIHGDCCIGNSGQSNDVPTLGENVDIGWGAMIVGNVTVADGVIIGANAVVTKSIVEPRSTWAGVPARRIK